MSSATRCFEGKVALVTGSSRGIGRVIAAHLASLGASVAVHGTTPHSARAFNEAESLEAVAKEIAAQTGSEMLAVHGDLTDEQSVKRVVGEVRARFGRIDFLVNCAGGDIGAQGTSGPEGGKPQPNDCVYIPVADIRAVIERNLMSCILMCREVAPEMMERRSGRIINISSIGGSIGRENGGIYGTAKAAVSHYTRCLGAQLRKYNVAVNAIAPGAIMSPRFMVSRPIDESRVTEETTLESYGRPMDIAKVVEFFCSPLSDYITAQVLRVDGGAQTWAV
ncbi:MAG: SDR family oxidoreductase [Bacteroidetes bacterium]|nr:SDR family oxidoreductase [Bacteroidota bacterium]MCL5025645.1 SDR family oxidoreductase [Chloroflexota bacterium]